MKRSINSGSRENPKTLLSSDTTSVGMAAMYATLLCAALACPKKIAADNSEKFGSAEKSTHDLIEYNNFYGDDGMPIFDQLVFYTWNGEESRFDVDAWRFVDTESRQKTCVVNGEKQTFMDLEATQKGQSMIHRYDHCDGLHKATWQDGDVVRSTRARSYRTTWTQIDPDIAQRPIRPVIMRPDLLRPHKKP